MCKCCERPIYVLHYKKDGKKQKDLFRTYEVEPNRLSKVGTLMSKTRNAQFIKVERWRPFPWENKNTANTYEPSYLKPELKGV